MAFSDRLVTSTIALGRRRRSSMPATGDYVAQRGRGRRQLMRRERREPPPRPASGMASPAPGLQAQAGAGRATRPDRGAQAGSITGRLTDADLYRRERRLASPPRTDRHRRRRSRDSRAAETGNELELEIARRELPPERWSGRRRTQSNNPHALCLQYVWAYRESMMSPHQHSRDLQKISSQKPSELCRVAAPVKSGNPDGQGC